MDALAAERLARFRPRTQTRKPPPALPYGIKPAPKHKLLKAASASCLDGAASWDGQRWHNHPQFDHLGPDPLVLVEYHEKTGVIRRIIVDRKTYPDECHLMWDDFIHASEVAPENKKMYRAGMKVPDWAYKTR